jgi:hypothetical protein
MFFVLSFILSFKTWSFGPGHKQGLCRWLYLIAIEIAIGIEIEPETSPMERNLIIRQSTINLHYPVTCIDDFDSDPDFDCDKCRRGIP